MVYPSGLALAMAAMPMVNVPPGLLTTVIGWRRNFSASLEIKRMARSVGPPGGRGVIKVTDRLGYFATSASSEAGAGGARKRKRTRHERKNAVTPEKCFFIFVSPLLSIVLYFSFALTSPVFTL